MNPQTGEAEYLLYGDVNKSINGGISGFIISLNFVIAVILSAVLIASLVSSIVELFAFFAAGTIGAAPVFILGLFDMLLISEEMDSVIYAMDLYYRAMHGDEEAEKQLENYNAVKGTTIVIISMLFGILNKMLAREGSEVKIEELPNGAESAKGLVGQEFEDYLTRNIGGEGSFKVGGREFDGGVGLRWWEAKSGNYWNMIENNPNMLAKFKSVMGNGLRIAQENGATYELFTNSPIPESIKTWLIKKGIPFTEILY